MKILRWIIGFIVFVSIAVWLGISDISMFYKWFYILLLACFMVLFRILRGRTPADRAVGVDILGIMVIGFSGILALTTQKDIYLDIAIAWALQAFIATLALAKYLEGRSFDD